MTIVDFVGLLIYLFPYNVLNIYLAVARVCTSCYLGIVPIRIIPSPLENNNTYVETAELAEHLNEELT